MAKDKSNNPKDRKRTKVDDVAGYNLKFRANIRSFPKRNK